MLGTELLPIGEVARRAGLATLRPALLRAGRAGAARAAAAAASGAIPAASCAGWRSSGPRRTSGCRWTRSRPALATLPDARTPTVADWTRLSRTWRQRLDEQIEGLMALRDGLSGCIGCGCLSLRTCVLNNPRDVAGDFGTGAQYLPETLRAHDEEPERRVTGGSTAAPETGVTAGRRTAMLPYGGARWTTSSTMFAEVTAGGRASGTASTSSSPGSRCSATAPQPRFPWSARGSGVRRPITARRRSTTPP